MSKILPIRRFALLLLATLGLAGAARADDSYLVHCRYYYQDPAVQINSSADFVSPIGFYGGYVPGTTVAFTCTPEAISTLADAKGYYVTGWDLDAYWGGKQPGTFTPTHRKQYGAVNPLSITFSSSSLGFSPSECELIPHISMMHYTLAYDKNAADAMGTAPTAADHYWSESVTAAGCVFSRTGYTQKDAWNTKADGSGGSVTSGQTMTGATFPVTNHNQAVTLYAQWQANSYNVNLAAPDADPTSEHTTAITVTYDQTPAKIAKLPTRQMWKFAGYYTETGGKGDQYFDEDGTATCKWQATSVTELYAHWVTYSCRVTFLVDGDGKVSPSGSGDYESGAIVVATAEPLEGAAFDRWSDGVTSPSRNITIVSNATYTAFFTTRDYTLQYSYYDTNIEWVTVSQYYQHGDVVTPPTDYDNLPGYHSTHWDPTPPETATKDGYYIMQYAANQYVVFFDGNGADGGAAIASKTLTYGEKYKLPANTYTKAGYSFIGWNIDPQAEEALYDDKEEVSDLAEKGKVTLYAIWAPNSYIVQFDGNGATGGATESQAFTYDQAQALTANGFTSEGQEFLRWHDAKNNADYTDGQVVSNLTTTAGDTVTLTAVWSNYHYVRFDRNGATNETEMTLQKFSGAETNALSANLYGKVGYTFAGWATNAVSATNLVVTYTNRQEAAFPLAKANETNVLYAVWATNRYTIVFDPGTNLKSPYFFGAMAPLTNCVYDTAITVKCGYTNYCSQGLLGWTRTKGSSTPEFVAAHLWDVEEESARVTGRGGDATVSNVSDVPNGTNTLYAVWADEGEMSKAAGLTNAVLYETKSSGSTHWGPATQTTLAWDTNHNVRVACTNASSTADSGERILSMKVRGSGTLRFCWCSRPADNTGHFMVRTNGVEAASWLNENMRKTNWDNPVELKICGAGEMLIDWSFQAKLQKASPNNYFIAIDDVTWTPGVEVKPGEEMPTYETKEAAEEAAKSTTVTRPNAEVEAVVSAADYNAMFDVKAVPVDAANGGSYTLAIELKPSVSNEVQTALNEAETNLISVITNNPISVSVAMKPGLYYGLAATNEVEWLSLAVPATWLLGGRDDGTPLSAPRPSDTEAFYELRMAITKPE